MPAIYASKSPEIEPRETAHKELSQRLAGECIVLLENDGALPLRQKGNIALYGNGARDTVKGGTGSGDVNTREYTNIEQGFLHAGYTITSTAWLDRQAALTEQSKKEYTAWSQEEAAKKQVPVFTVLSDHPYEEPAPVLITQKDCEASDADTAVYVIARNSGEGADRCNAPGDYLLFLQERENLEMAASYYKNLIVVLNIGGVMDLSWIGEIKGINAVILMGQLGSIGGDALLDVLTGKVNPSGKTVDTWAKHYMDYPSSAEFSHNGSVHEEYYTDGIYVGYRYFDSFFVEPLYSFGFGRSYTDFAIQTDHAEVIDGNVQVTVTVRNTGSRYAGKEVVQVYYSAPQGTIGRPYQELAAYRKTALLAPGEAETLKITFAVKDMASYVQKQAAWVLDKGEYVIRVGSSAAASEPAAVLVLEADVTTQIGKNLFPLDCEMEEIKPDAKLLTAKQAADAAGAARRIVLDVSSIKTEQMVYRQGSRDTYKTDKRDLLTAADVKNGTCTVEELVSQLTVEEMAELCVGTLREGGGSIVGNASCFVPGAAGDTSSVIRESRGVLNMILADGPAGLRLQPHFKTDKHGKLLPGGEIMGDTKNPFSPDLKPEETDDYYQYCTAIPIGWSIAQSWNEDLAAKAGDMIGSEMEQFHVDLWLAPALNIHRNPLCGRNFEYYSEDPLIAGKMAAAITNGVQKHPGKGTTIKHFAVNNQEENRYFVNAHVSERALREIYLKGFEIAIKQAQPLSLMTSYNLLNGVHTANCYDLIQAAARDEWGFLGVVMTDWFTSQDVPAITGKYTPKYPISASSGCIFAGNDLQMPGCQKNVDDIVRAVKTGEEVDGYTITLGDLQYCAANIIRVALKML